MGNLMGNDLRVVRARRTSAALPRPLPARIADPDEQALRDVVIPSLLDRPRAHGGLRIWCAGCGTGGRARRLAALLAEAMPGEWLCDVVRMYATDEDPANVAVARSAEIPLRLRSTIIYGRHALADHPPIPHLDLLVCEARLDQFPFEVRARVAARFHCALGEGGLLMLPAGSAPPEEAGNFAGFPAAPGLFRKLELGSAERLRVLKAAICERTARPRRTMPLPPDADSVLASNQELQSRLAELALTSVELENVNGQLEATNDELVTANARLRERTQQVQGLASTLESGLAHLGIALMTVDDCLVIKSLNAVAEHVLGVPAFAARGRKLPQLGARLPVRRLIPAIQACLGTSASVPVALQVERPGEPASSWHGACQRAPELEGGRSVLVMLVPAGELPEGGEP